VNANRDRVQLSTINSGATIYNPAPRGPHTFSTVSDYQFEERRKTRSRLGWHSGGCGPTRRSIP
jgi:Family of unknown function (DUF7002)